MDLFCILAIAAGLFNNSHDVTTLRAWGPYSKTYSGISHVEDVSSGNSVDFSLVPGMYRRSYLIPNALYESGCLPWKVSPDMGRICWRYELEWKDRVYIDATYHVLDEGRVLLEMKCVNATEENQNILLQTLASVHFAKEDEHPSEDFFPQWSADGGDYIVKYKSMGKWYGVATNFPVSEVKRYENGLLDFFMRRTVHRHPPVCFHGDSRGHYTASFQRPVVLAPNRDTTIWNLLVCGDKSYVSSAIASFHSDEAAFTNLVSEDGAAAPECLPEGRQYGFGEQILEATLLTNIAYPIVAEGQNIRHFTPGKNWNSLYTWDSGFISWALGCLDPVKSFETIRAYTTAPGSKEAFIHHGSPLPTQFFAFEDLLSKTSDWEMAAFMYPRLKQYYDFFAGHDDRSNTMMPSGFVRTWDLWYSTGGWDDYPPQHWLRSHTELYPSIAPAVSTSYYLRAAKILRMMAQHLGCKADVRQYDKDIRKMSDAVLRYAWDPASSYFSYVTHDASGKPDGFLKAPDGSNFNMGLDGVSPLAAGICTPQQRDALLARIFSEEHLWTSVGISTVDKTASYYSPDGYWNGCVWMPHQFILWKSMLDLGLPDNARKIALTALDAWKKETALTYESFEHFIISSGRGAGWHNFSGLSSPIINWWYAYFKPGTINTGFDAICIDAAFGEDNASLKTGLLFDKDSYGRSVTLIVCLAPGEYKVTVGGKKAEFSSPWPGLLEIPVKSAKGLVSLEIVAR